MIFTRFLVIAAACLMLQAAAAVAAGEPQAQTELQGPAGTKSWSLHVQATSVTQQHFSLKSPYAAANSLNHDGEYKTSYTATLFAGFRLWSGGEFYVNEEGQMGTGLSKTLGIAGYPNGEIYRVDTSKPKGSLVRYYYKHTFALGSDEEVVADDQNQIAGKVAVSRFTVLAGRFSLNDFFDTNKYAHDPRTQFLNWSLMDAAAWDYAADTRGYTNGVMLELNQPAWALRFASVMVPKVANQMQLEWEKYPVPARGDNLELELRYQLLARPGAVRLLGYMNHTHGGNYREAIATAGPGNAPPDVSATRAKYGVKKGVAFNAEQEVDPDVGLFTRLAWNDGTTETWAFTEVDRSGSLGVSGKGGAWGRREDGFGLALMINALSPEHRDYLAAGGLGFIIGDGKLSYAPEKIAEVYYNVGLLPYLQVSPDYQYVTNPAFNQARGPVQIFGLRIHAQI